jgi:hypothetical protein
MKIQPLTIDKQLKDIFPLNGLFHGALNEKEMEHYASNTLLYQNLSTSVSYKNNCLMPFQRLIKADHYLNQKKIWP